MLAYSNMTREMLICFVLSLGSFTNSFTSSARVPPSLKPQHRIGIGFRGDNNASDFSRRSPQSTSPPWLSVRGGDSSGAIGTVTSLKSSVVGAIDTFYKTMPLASAFVTCGVKAALADTVAQKRAAKQAAQATTADGYTENDTVIISEIDQTPFEKRRNFAFFLYGGLYQGMAQLVLFNEIFPRIFGTGTDPLTVLSKVLADSLVITPFICLPVAYGVKSIIFGYSFKEAFSRYRDDVMNNGLLVKYWSLWSPVQFLTFGVVPEHLRIVFIAFVSFFWLIIFSSVTAKGQKERDGLDDTCSLEDGVSCRIDG